MGYFWVDAGLITLACCALVLGCYWAGVFYHAIRTERRLLTARQAATLPAPWTDPQNWPSVCVIIPAHNEAANIEALARSLLTQDYPAGKLHITLALDRCTDQTQPILERITAGSPHFSIHVVSAWLPDWAGKVNAVWQAVLNTPSAKTADLLLFADADTVFDPGCISATVKLLYHRNCGMLSLLSTLAARTWFEKIVQPASAMELLRQFPPLQVNKSLQSRSLANGQYMLIRRAVYEQLGGHAAVSDALLEDITLAAYVKHAGHMSEVAFADGMLLCRMYDTWAQFVSGWRRIYVELANRKPSRIDKAALVNFSFGFVLPLCAVAAIPFGLIRAGGEGIIQQVAPVCVAVAAFGLLAYLAFLTYAYLRSRAPLWAIPLHPLASLATAWILWTSARQLVAGVPVKWAGRQYVRTPR